MSRHQSTKSHAEQDAALSAATHGAIEGALRWGLYSAALSAIAYYYSPVYRGLTVQFKIYMGMSGMILGGMIWADRGVQKYEWQLREQRRAREREAHLAALEAEERRLGIVREKKDG